MSALLNDLFHSLNPANQQAILAKCTVYPSRTPARVVYQSQADAEAHTDAFKAWPAKPECVGYTPAFCGWQEADKACEFTSERRAEIRDQEGADHQREDRKAAIARGE